MRQQCDAERLVVSVRVTRATVSSLPLNTAGLNVTRMQRISVSETDVFESGVALGSAFERLKPEFPYSDVVRLVPRRAKDAAETPPSV
jgi:hypothetical protein